MEGRVVVLSTGSGGDGVVRALSSAGQAFDVADSAARVVGGATPEVVVVVGANAPVVAELRGMLPEHVRVVATEVATGQHAAPQVADCIVAVEPAILQAALQPPAPLDMGRVVEELLGLTLVGPGALQQATERIARAFDADDCVLVLAGDNTCYSARGLSDAALAELVPRCDGLCQAGTTVIAAPGAALPYRTLLAIELADDNSSPVGRLVLGRERPVVFDRRVRANLGRLASRLSKELSWHLVHERLFAGRANKPLDPIRGLLDHIALQQALLERVGESERRGEPCSAALIDIDALRLINARYGYRAGDAALGRVANIALRHIEAEDVVARCSGSSIALLLPGKTDVEAKALIGTILSAVDAEPLVHEGASLNLTLSAGVAAVRYETDTGEAALGRALTARKLARVHGEVIEVADDSVLQETLAAPDFAIGTTLGGIYQIRHEISRGAFGVVYRAEDLSLGRHVALKLLRPDLAQDAAFVERLRGEASTLARIGHPNLVQVYAFGVQPSSAYFAMELVEGPSLYERIVSAHRRKRHLPLPEVISTIEQVGDALEAIHRAGVLHRDVKPDNVLVDRILRRCVLVDVGIAIRRGAEKSPAGTPGYTAPEVFGSPIEGPATDVYGLAALSYLLLTLEMPFRGNEPLEILERQRSAPQAPTSYRRDLPAAVDEILVRALDPDPTQRQQSVRELVRSLTTALNEVETDRARRPRMTAEILRSPKQPALVVPDGPAPVLSFPDRPADSSMEVEMEVVPADEIRIEPTQPRALDVRSSATLLIKNASATSAPGDVPSTRGVLFRSLYQVLGARRGNAWMNELVQQSSELAGTLGSQSNPLSWYPTNLFVTALGSLGDAMRDGHSLGWHVGKAAAESSFEAFYGADPTAVSTANVFLTAGTFWRAYHSWGAVVVAAAEGRADLAVMRVPQSGAALCECTAGVLAGLATVAGARNVRVEHTRCVSRGRPVCGFEVVWDR